MTINIRAGGVWKVGNIRPWVYAASAWRTARVVWARQFGLWVRIAEYLSAINVTGTTSIARGNTVSNTVAAAVGGYGAVSYSWTRISGAGQISAGAATATPWFFQSAAGASTFRCTCTDAMTGDVVTKNWTITWT